MSVFPTLSVGAIEAIVGGYHGDVFAVLGPHTHAEGTVVRVFEPDAAGITLIELNGQTRSLTMVRVADGGFFEVIVDNDDLKYELEVLWGGGETWRRADPYAFGTTFSEYDRYLLGEGSDVRAWSKLGAHLMEVDEVAGTRFAVWAPNAERVSVVGDFNFWDGRRHAMRFHTGCGIWELFVPGVGEGTHYKYEIKTYDRGYVAKKSDPVGFYSEVRPNTASIVWDIHKYQWQDDDWLLRRPETNSFSSPISVYELHLGSWQRGDANEWLDYAELTRRLIPYVKQMGFTHIELLPVSEHPLDASWGYQVTGYFAPSSRFGKPEAFKAFVDACHQNDIGVIIDWVPAHFPKDEHGLAYFDGTHLYEHEDPRKGTQPDWGTLIFNYERHEVRQFLISNALFWIENYHVDGIRVDAVASMLYLDFSREADEWVPNVYGGRENLDAINFIRQFNSAVHEYFPGVITIAEESTDWVGVTAPPEDGGLGFDMKWNMGWMHDSLKYIKSDPIHRVYEHGTLTFSLLYAFTERFMLPYSHDEVVHLKKSMLSKMPGDEWQQFANLRLLYGYMWGHPGKKLIFMGSEFGQIREWNENLSLDWHLVSPDSPHQRLSDWVRDLNWLYGESPPLYEDDASWNGFNWLEVHDSANSVLSWVRWSPISGEPMIVICNFTPIVRHGYRLGVPLEGSYVEVQNSDRSQYGGSNVINDGLLHTQPGEWRNQPCSILLSLPPLSCIYLRLS